MFKPIFGAKIQTNLLDSAWQINFRKFMLKSFLTQNCLCRTVWGVKGYFKVSYQSLIFMLHFMHIKSKSRVPFPHTFFKSLKNKVWQEFPVILNLRNSLEYFWYGDHDPILSSVFQKSGTDPLEIFQPNFCDHKNYHAACSRVAWCPGNFGQLGID